MRWAEQRLNLTGNQRQDYGNYANVPLRGLGDSGDGLGFALTPEMTAAMMRTSGARSIMMTLVAPAPGSGDQGGGDEDVASQIARAAAEAEAAAAAAFATNTVEQPVDVPLVEDEDEGFFDKKLGPVPVWALGLGGIVVVGGGAWFMLRKKKPKKNRRRRRRR
jgi:hypothetical protein